jgi:hypothetical protein
MSWHCNKLFRLFINHSKPFRNLTNHGRRKP